MKEPVVLDKTIEVDRPLAEVFAYVADFASIQEWDPGVRSAEKLTEGPPAVDTRFRVDMNLGFSLYYTIVDIEQNERVLMSVDSKVFTAEEEILFAETPAGGTAVRYIATFDFPATLTLLNRVYPRMMERVGEGTMEGLRAALEDDFDAPEASGVTAFTDKLVLPGLWRFTRLGYKSSRRKWKPMSASLEGRHIVITGATSGLGLAAASALAEKGADLTLVVRDVTRGKRVAKSLQEKCGCPPVKVERCDMAEMADVHALAERMLKRKRPIDVLINNAGALFNPRQETSEGFEKSFALLLLGPYILTERLQPLLSKATDARVVNVLSGGMYSQGIDVDDLQSEEGDYSGSNAYARAKRGLMILTEEWAEQWSGDGITVNAMHPGWANTAGVRDALPEFYKVTKSILRTPEEGADTIVWLAAASEANQVSGKFWLDREQHPPHIFPHTKETAEDRATLLLRLAEYKAATAEQTAVA